MKKLHFVGIGGIGMSGLAAMARNLGWQISGSDRGADRPENRQIFSALKKQGVGIYPQNGIFVRDGMPDYIVYSTAIEENNPDFLAAGSTPRLHRSELLGMLMNELEGKETIAVTGSCGKSTVTAYLAEALFNAGADPTLLNGALSKRFKSEKFAGNFHPGNGKYVVFEADESDKSLLNYKVDYAVVLNIGTDHYSKEELAEVFGKFLNNTRKGAVVSAEVYEAVKEFIPETLPVEVFYPYAEEGKKFALENYWFDDHVPLASFSGCAPLQLPQSGRYMALNALAIFAMLKVLGFTQDTALTSLKRFDGISRRMDFVGKTSEYASVYDDYAHNPEKIISCIDTLKEKYDGKIFAVFQPHGYQPLSFMRDALFDLLEKHLDPEDRFIMLEPYYAGGTTSFKPTASSVIEDWKKQALLPELYLHFGDKGNLQDYLLLHAKKDDVIVIMGARDNSLSEYAAGMTKK